MQKEMRSFMEELEGLREASQKQPLKRGLKAAVCMYMDNPTSHLSTIRSSIYNIIYMYIFYCFIII